MNKNRDRYGRFIKGHKVADGLTAEQRAARSRKGGRARAAALPAHRRVEIARTGFAAMVRLYFDGDKQKALSWLQAKAAFVTDEFARDAGYYYQFPDPGPFPKKST